MKSSNAILLVLIIILAGFLRLYQLGQNPPALDWDEASLGYNAYSLLKTGKDEFGRPWPISIRSFEDYKPAMYTYLTMIPVAVFGLNEYAVRLPSALFGTFTVLVTYFLIKKLFNEKIAVLTAFLLAISPWHLQFSRVAFESNVSLFFVFGGLLFFLYGLKNGYWMIPSVMFLAASFYTYHSPRLVVPIILLGWSWYFRDSLLKQKKYVAIVSILGCILLVPFVNEAFTSGRARLSSVTVLSPQGRLDDSIKQIDYDESNGNVFGRLFHNRRIIYTLAVIKGYLDHFNMDFLFLNGDTPDRHHARDMGMLYVWEAPFILIGLFVLLRKNNSFPIIWWFLVAPAASAITTGTPHAVRALLYLPTYQVFAAFGVLTIFQRFNKLQLSFSPVKLFGYLLIVVMFTNVYYYFEMYYVHTPIEAAKDWQYGYKEVVNIVQQWENQVDKVVITYKYDQPHIFVLFYTPVDPLWYQRQWQGGEVLRDKRNFGKYEFRNIDWEKDQNDINALYIGTPKEIPEATAGHIADIQFPDGTIAFRIIKR